MQKSQNKAKSVIAICCKVFSIIIALLVLGVGIWIFKTKDIVNMSVPVRNFPNPNAYDYYLKAANQIVKSGDIEYAISKPKRLPLSHNPMISPPAGLPKLDSKRLAQFKSMMPISTPLQNLPARSYSLKDKQALLNANLSTLGIFREGLKHKCMIPVYNKFSVSSGFPKHRELARLISLETQVYAEAGKYNEATQSCLDGLQMGSAITQGSSLMGCIDATAVSAINAYNLQPDLIKRLNAAEAKTAAARLEQIVSGYASFNEIIQNEKLASIKSMKSTTSTVAPLANTGNIGDLIDNIKVRIMLTGYITDWNRMIEYVDQPYTQYVKSPTPRFGILLQILAPVIQKARYKYEYTITTDQMLMLQFALQAYKATNGNYPTSLAVLKPKYLKKIPSDRFASSRTYKYKLTPKGYTLYSIGPDGKDDRGKAISSSKTPKIDDQGDIVVEPSK